MKWKRQWNGDFTAAISSIRLWLIMLNNGKRRLSFWGRRYTLKSKTPAAARREAEKLVVKRCKEIIAAVEGKGGKRG